MTTDETDETLISQYLAAGNTIKRYKFGHSTHETNLAKLTHDERKQRYFTASLNYEKCRRKHKNDYNNGLWQQPSFGSTDGKAGKCIFDVIESRSPPRIQSLFRQFTKGGYGNERD